LLVNAFRLTVNNSHVSLMQILSPGTLAETQRSVVGCNPIHSGLAEGTGSAEMENLG